MQLSTVLELVMNAEGMLVHKHKAHIEAVATAVLLVSKPTPISPEAVVSYTAVASLRHR
jgi:hypothetical protein